MKENEKHLRWSLHPLNQLSEQLSQLLLVHSSNAPEHSLNLGDLQKTQESLLRLAGIEIENVPPFRKIADLHFVECRNEMRRLLNIYSELVSNSQDRRWETLQTPRPELERASSFCTNQVEDVRRK